MRQYQHNASERQQRHYPSPDEQYRTEELLRRARTVEGNLQEMNANFDPQWSEAQRQSVIAELQTLLTGGRQQLLEKLSSGYANLITELVAMDEAQRKLGNQAVQWWGHCSTSTCCGFASSPTLDAECLKGMKLTVDWLVNLGNWQAVGNNLGSQRSYYS